jgi:hypothetical protein
MRGEFRRGYWPARSSLEQARAYSSQTFSDSVALAYSLQSVTRHDVLVRRINQPRGLFSTAPFVPLRFQYELEWAYQQLIRNADLLAAFRMQVHALNDAFYSGDANTIQQALDSIAITSGESSWLIEARVSALQNTQGLDVQRLQPMYRSISAILRALGNVCQKWGRSFRGHSSPAPCCGDPPGLVVEESQVVVQLGRRFIAKIIAPD